MGQWVNKCLQYHSLLLIPPGATCRSSCTKPMPDTIDDWSNEHHVVKFLAGILFSAQSGCPLA